jgi:hypothetical protein
MKPVVPKFIDELIDFRARDKKQDQVTGVEKPITQEPALNLGKTNQKLWQTKQRASNATRGGANGKSKVSRCHCL